jgi:hypothetical protein
MESEEFPMSPDIISREQKKDTHLKEVINKIRQVLKETCTKIYSDNI